MLSIIQISGKEFLVEVPKEWNGHATGWVELLPAIRPYIGEDVTFFIDLGKIDVLPGVIFNVLYELASSIRVERCKLVFTNINEAISERIGLLSFSAE